MNDLIKITKPIIFNPEMVKAVLDGRKTQFRQICKSKRIQSCTNLSSLIIFNTHIQITDESCNRFNILLPYQKNGILKVKEKYSKSYALIKIINITVQRLQDIILDDIEKEGFNNLSGFFHHDLDNALEWWEQLWNSTAKDGYKWEHDPYVFVYEFERVEK